MTTYETACLLVKLLNEQGIDSNITQGGVSIVYKRHQRKPMLAILNAMKEHITRVGVLAYLQGKGSMHVTRHESKPISVSHKRN